MQVCFTERETPQEPNAPKFISYSVVTTMIQTEVSNTAGALVCQVNLHGNLYGYVQSYPNAAVMGKSRVF